MNISRRGFLQAMGVTSVSLLVPGLKVRQESGMINSYHLGDPAWEHVYGRYGVYMLGSKYPWFKNKDGIYTPYGK